MRNTLRYYRYPSCWARETLTGTITTLPSRNGKHSQVLLLPFLLGTGNTLRYYCYPSFWAREALPGTIATLPSRHGKHSKVLSQPFHLGTGNTLRYCRYPLIWSLESDRGSEILSLPFLLGTGNTTGTIANLPCVGDSLPAHLVTGNTLRYYRFPWNYLSLESNIIGTFPSEYWNQNVSMLPAWAQNTN